MTSRGDLSLYLAENAEAFRRTAGFASFFEQLSPEESRRLAALWDSVGLMAEWQEQEAGRVAETLLRRLPDEDDGHGGAVVRAFAESLLGRVRQLLGSGGNLYLEGRPPGAQLRAFELMRLRTPLISFAYAAANRALLESIPGPSDVTLLDLGIGRGGQLRSLLRTPQTRKLVRSLHVIGVEPDSSAGGGALETAAQNVLGAAAEVGIATTFHGIGKRAEDLTPADLERAGARGVRLANSAFSLHHVAVAAAAAPEPRGRVLRLVRDAGYAALVLVEPDSNHFTDALATRFAYAYRHYRTLHQVLTAQLAAADAGLVWSEFFAPEVRNVVGHEGANRTERHEETVAWVDRLGDAGWHVDKLVELVPQAAAPAGFEVKAVGSAFCLLFRGISLLGVMRARATG